MKKKTSGIFRLKRTMRKINKNMVKKDILNILEVIIIFSIFMSFLIISTIVFSSLKGITGYYAYSSSVDTNLSIWDDTNDIQGENTVHYISEQIGFYANFTNLTNALNGTGICQIKFNLTGNWEGLDNMSFNQANQLYEYSKSFSSNGSFYFNILCDGTSFGYSVLNVSDDFDVGYLNYIDNCTTINFPGTYYLQNNITDSSVSYCIKIPVDDVILDCQGNIIDGDDVADYGVYISRPVPSESNITIKSCVISGWDSAGLSMRYVSNNSIYDNLFNNTDNFEIIPASYEHKWNITKTSSTNIFGSPFIGGNFWAFPNGTGFSEICNDISPIDGICDNSYTLNANNIDYLPLVYDSYPSVNLINPSNGLNTTSDTLNFQCSASDDKGLENLTLYVWDSANTLSKNNVNVTGTSNDSVWSVSGLADDNYKWNCRVSDNLGQSVFAANNFSFNVNIPSSPAVPSGGGGGKSVPIPTIPLPSEEPAGPELTGTYTAEEAGRSIMITAMGASSTDEFTFITEGRVDGEIYNPENGKILEGLNIEVTEIVPETSLMVRQGVAKQVNSANPITGFVIRDRVDIPVLENGVTSESNPLIIQKFVQYNIGPGIYISTSQVNQKPLRTEPIKKFISSRLEPGKSIKFEINLSLGLMVEDKVLVMEFRSFNTTFATKEILIKANPPVFGFSLDRSEGDDIADAYIIISNINQRKTDYYIGLEINRPPGKGYKTEAGLKGLLNSLLQGPSMMYYDYLGPYTLDTDESTLLTQRFIFDEMPRGSYMFNAVLYHDHRPLVKIFDYVNITR